MAQRRGDAAKSTVINTILETFEGSFLLDKKVYINVKDGPGGEIVQLALSLTMPKVAVAAQPIEAPPASSLAAWDTTPAELDPADKKKIAELCDRLNLS